MTQVFRARGIREFQVRACGLQQNGSGTRWLPAAGAAVSGPLVRWDAGWHVGLWEHVCFACPPVTRGHSSSSAKPTRQKEGEAGAQAQQRVLGGGLERLGAWHSDPRPRTGPHWGLPLCTGPSLPGGTLLLQQAVGVPLPQGLLLEASRCRTAPEATSKDGRTRAWLLS